MTHDERLILEMELEGDIRHDIAQRAIKAGWTWRKAEAEHKKALRRERKRIVPKKLLL